MKYPPSNYPVATGVITLYFLLMKLTPKQIEQLKGRIIAIDGPAGAGKTTTATLVAEQIHFTYLDTGAMYRAITVVALQKGISPSDADVLTQIAQSCDLQFEIKQSVNHVIINGQDVTKEIRTPDVTSHVSEVSAHVGVREVMVALQKTMSENGSVVAEGRDTTTVVFPKADLKVYLDASVEQRAQRRVKDMVAMGIQTTLEEQIADIERRDAYDSGRAHSPLTKAEDAHVVDTSNLTIEGQVDRIIELALENIR